MIQAPRFRPYLGLRRKALLAHAARDALAAASELSGHRMQPGAPPSEPVKPRLHTQDAADTLPAGLSVSTGQAVQVCAALTSLYEPDGHSRQTAPVTLYLPAGQARHCIASDAYMRGSEAAERDRESEA